MEKPDFGTRFQFPENIHVEYDGAVGSIQNEIAVRMAEKYEDFVIQQIAMEARAEGVSDLTVLNKEAILNAIKKQIPQKPVDKDDWKVYGHCPVCRKLVHIGEDYCDQCGQAIDWEEA